MPWHSSINGPAESYRVTTVPGLSSDLNNNIVSKSYAGFINVGPPDNPNIKHNLFFWYFPSAIPSTKIIFYLNGGPGCTSLIGLFKINGPMQVVGRTFAANPNSWHLKAHLVYIDQPIFTGFSHSTSSGPLKSELQISKMMHAFIERFLVIFSWMQDYSIVLAGESYAGQYLPHIARMILLKNVFAQWSGQNGYIRLETVAIGSPWINPVEQYKSYYDFTFAQKLDFGNDTFAAVVRQRQLECEATISTTGELTYILECERVLDELLSFISIRSGKTQCFNYYEMSKGFAAPRTCVDTLTISDLLLFSFVNSPSVRTALHLGANPIPSPYSACSPTVWNALSPEGSLPSHPLLFSLASRGINVMLWVGTDDFITNYFGVESSIAKGSWGGSQGFLGGLEPISWQGRNLGVGRTERKLAYYRLNGVGHFTIGSSVDASQFILDKIMSPGSA
ncbi:Cell death protease [Nowakowskiella sp. JEL0407]|nr:Cell death protease [Nowakowskiella sp. JEL0407]